MQSNLSTSDDHGTNVIYFQLFAVQSVYMAVVYFPCRYNSNKDCYIPHYTNGEYTIGGLGEETQSGSTAYVFKEGGRVV